MIVLQPTSTSTTTSDFTVPLLDFAQVYLLYFLKHREHFLHYRCTVALLSCNMLWYSVVVVRRCATACTCIKPVCLKPA